MCCGNLNGLLLMGQRKDEGNLLLRSPSVTGATTVFLRFHEKVPRAYQLVVLIDTFFSSLDILEQYYIYISPAIAGLNGDKSWSLKVIAYLRHEYQLVNEQVLSTGLQIVRPRLAEL